MWRALKTHSGALTSYYKQGCQMVWLLWITAWQLLTKLNMPLSYDPEIPLQVVSYMSETKTYFHTKASVSFYRSFILYHQKELFYISNSVLATQLHVFIKICIIITFKSGFSA